MTASPVVTCEGLGHFYGEREALHALDLSIPEGVLFALLGPNGGGKSTLFRILATLLTPTRGTARVAGYDVRSASRQVRASIGVAFQSPSLDGKLSVRENLLHQGHLYGLRGAELAERMDQLLRLFGLTDRARDRAETLSGGLARRVDLAKAMLHAPRVLLLDEPSTGLDPGARRDLLGALADLRRRSGTTVLLTTHLTEEAEGADGVAILDSGRIVASGSPAELTREIGSDIVTLTVEEADTEALAAEAAERVGEGVTSEPGTVRLEHASGATVLPELLGLWGARVRAATIARPTLEDVFFRRTGKVWSREGEDA